VSRLWRNIDLGRLLRECRVIAELALANVAPVFQKAGNVHRAGVVGEPTC